MVRNYVRKTLDKTKPEVRGRMVIDQPGYCVVWAFTTKRPPVPRKVANLVVFIRPQPGKPVPHKRSYRVGWKGGVRMAVSDDLLRLRTEHPGLLEEVLQRLARMEERMVNPEARRGSWSRGGARKRAVRV